MLHVNSIGEQGNLILEQSTLYSDTAYQGVCECRHGQEVGVITGGPYTPSGRGQPGAGARGVALWGGARGGPLFLGTLVPPMQELYPAVDRFL